MAFQLVYTSAAKLLDAGRSGYGTVARSKSISPLVVSAIERVSQFANLRGLDRNRVIYVHRRITAGSNRFHVLTRIVDAGADYTGRTNHLAHHLVISQEEAAKAAARGVTPADVLRQFQWLGRWDGNARFFDASEDVPLESFRPNGKNSGGKSWSAITGNPAHSRLLSFEGAPRTGVLIVPERGDSLALLAEALVGFGPQSWSRSFTTSLETTDELSELEWIITTPSAFQEIQPRCGSRTQFDLTKPGTLPSPPAPVAAASQTVQSETRQHAPGIHESLTSAPSTLQSGANPVHVRTAGNGSSAAGTSSQRSSPKKDQKTQTKLLLGFAALLLVSGTLVFFVLDNPKNDRHPNSDHSATSPSQPGEASQKQMVAAKKMTDSGIADVDAKAIANNAGDQQAENWANFITDFLAGINGYKPGGAIDSLRGEPFKDPPSRSPDWLKDLIAARIAIMSYSDSSKSGKELVECLVRLSDVTRHLKSVAKSVGNDVLTEKACAEFDASLFRTEIEKLLNEQPDNAIVAKHLSEAIRRSPPQFHVETWEERSKNFCSVLQSEFERFTSKDLSNIPNEGGNNFKLSDRDGFKTALEYWNSRKQLLDQTDKDKIAKSAMVPKDFELLLNKHLDGSSNKQVEANSSPTLLPPEGSTQHFTNVPKKEIIIVSPEDLKVGVPVKILEATMKDKMAGPNTKEINLETQTIELPFPDSKDYKNSLLKLSDDSKYYCWTLSQNSNVPKYFIDGRFSLNKNGVTSVSFISRNKEALIVVDEESAPCIYSNLKFTYEVTGNDDAVIKGKLSDWINSSPNLNIILEPSIPSIRIEFEHGEYHLKRTTQRIPPIVFTEKSANTIKNALDSYTTISEKRGNTKEEKAQISKEATDALVYLKECIQKSMGRAQLYKDLNLKNKEIAKEHLDKINEILIEKYAGKKERSKFDDFEKDIEDIENRIGGQVFDAQLTQLAEVSNWETIEKKKLTDIKAHIEKILRNTRKPEPRKPFEEELKKVQSITVTSSKGRVLFKATKEP